MRILNHILTTLNAKLKVTNWLGTYSTQALDGLPLGSVGSSATGEIGLKTIVIGGSIAVTSESTAEATAAAPAYTEGQDAPLSQDRTGRLRVVANGATNIAISQVTATGTAATLAIARATRRSVLFTNTHTTASVRIGPATVTAGNGQILGPGQSCPFTWVGLFQIIDDGVTHPVVCVADEYD